MKVICESADICPRLEEDEEVTHCIPHERNSACKYTCDTFKNKGIVNTKCVETFQSLMSETIERAES